MLAAVVILHSFEENAVFDEKIAKKSQAMRHLANDIKKRDELSVPYTSRC